MAAKNVKKGGYIRRGEDGRFADDRKRSRGQVHSGDSISNKGEGQGHAGEGEVIGVLGIGFVSAQGQSLMYNGAVHPDYSGLGTGMIYQSTGSLNQINPLANEPDLFRSEEDYERVVNSVAARIRSGEIQPCEPDEEN